LILERHPIAFIATCDAKAAQTFYADLLGLELLESSPYALVFSDHGQMLRVQIVGAFSPASHTVHGWQVAEIEKEIEQLTHKGIVFLRFEQFEQSPSGVWTTPGGKIAWFKDPSGNILSLTEFAVP